MILLDRLKSGITSWIVFEVIFIAEKVNFEMLTEFFDSSFASSKHLLYFCSTADFMNCSASGSFSKEDKIAANESQGFSLESSTVCNKYR